MKKAVDKRVFRYKNPHTEFLCPLCGVERAVRYTSKLSVKNYIQIAMISVPVVYFLFPLMGERSFFVIFILWFIFEGVKRLLFSREIPCPHCGFDASWYKRDVKVARQKVKEFWDKKNSEKKEEEKHPETSHRPMDHFDLPPSELEEQHSQL